VGQLAADQEFMITQYGGLFINSGFGWPTLPAVDLPAGGPAYPFATPGVRLRVLPNGRTTLLLGVFNGNPAAKGSVSDPQLRNPSGANLRFQGTFVMAEAQYAVNQGEGATGLPATYKIGGWYNSNAFTDQFFIASGVSAAGPGSVPPPLHHGDWSLYGIVDQLVYRPPGAKGGGVGLFLRAMSAPANRNPQLAPWWQVQPDFQYILNPGGGILNPDGSGRVVGSAAVLGIRTVVTF
jgi:porin